MRKRQIVTASLLTSGDVARITGLITRAAEVDGVRALSEHGMLRLRYGGANSGRHLLAITGDDELAGYAQLDTTDPAADPAAELVVDPAHRGRGVGRALLDALRETAVGRLRLWAHGDLPAARALATGTGLERIRALWQMRRPLAAPLPEPAFPDGVRVRTFQPGRDETEWVALNRLAFADHPEQGGWTEEDLARREREPWFDPAGFFLAERAGRLIGFHWTKVHAPARSAGAGGTGGATGAAGQEPPIGEVYVVGVAPAARGTGLGRALTVAGLRHLRDLGLAQAMLYVDESNPAAIKLYESLGFTRHRVDAMYATAITSPAR